MPKQSRKERICVILDEEMTAAFRQWHRDLGTGDSSAESARMLLKIGLAAAPVDGALAAAMQAAFNNARNRVHARLAQALREIAEEVSVTVAMSGTGT